MINRGFLRTSIVAATALVALSATYGKPDAQSYSHGQNVSPAFEGWEQNPDGSFNLLFGYMNRNWDEEIHVPIGPENNIEPGGPDQGQPTRLLPRRNRFIFRVVVAKDWGKKELVWTLTTRGKTEKAFASLRPDYFVDDVVIASETGALGAGRSNPELRGNKRPAVRIEGEETRTIGIGQPLAIVASVIDDGIPKTRPAQPAAAAADGRAAEVAAAARARAMLTPPSRVTVGKRLGLHLSWFVYRGAGNVTFDPMQVKVWEDTRTGANSPWAPLWAPPLAPTDGKWSASAVFDAPGTYVLRARADDGALFADDEITVVVTR